MTGFLSLLLQCVALFCEGESGFLIPDHLGLQGQKLLQKSRGSLFVQSPGLMKEVACTRIQISSSFADDQLFIGAQGEGDFRPAQKGFEVLRDGTAEVVV